MGKIQRIIRIIWNILYWSLLMGSIAGAIYFWIQYWLYNDWLVGWIAIGISVLIAFIITPIYLALGTTPPEPRIQNKRRLCLYTLSIVLPCFVIYWYRTPIWNTLLTIYYAPVNILIDLIRSAGFWQPPLEQKVLDAFSFFAWAIIFFFVTLLICIVFDIQLLVGHVGGGRVGSEDGESPGGPA